MRRLIEWIKSFWATEYVLTVWYPGGTEYDPKTTRRVYKMESISKKTQTHLIGVQTNGNPLEIKTTKPFDYQIEQVK